MFPLSHGAGGKRENYMRRKFFWIQVVFGFIVVATAVQPLKDDEGLKVQYCTKVDFHVSYEEAIDSQGPTVAVA